jgi:hypothetical protein
LQAAIENEAVSIRLARNRPLPHLGFLSSGCSGSERDVINRRIFTGMVRLSFGRKHAETRTNGFVGRV